MKTYKEPKRLITKEQHLTMDLVCGMDIIAEKAKYFSTRDGVAYYFCSHNCKQHFENNPERYVWEK